MQPLREGRGAAVSRIDDAKPTDAEKRFIALLKLPETMRSGGTSGGPSLVAAKPHRTVIRSDMPELEAEAKDVAGPFTFEVDEAQSEGGGFEVVKADVAGTKGQPVEQPLLKLTMPLLRGKIYLWRVSAGEGENRKESSGVFMVAEQSTVDAAQKISDSLRLAEFYKAHGLFLEALAELDQWLAQKPNDAKAERMRKDVEKVLSPMDASQ